MVREHGARHERPLRQQDFQRERAIRLHPSDSGILQLNELRGSRGMWIGRTGRSNGSDARDLRDPASVEIPAGEVEGNGHEGYTANTFITSSPK